MYKYVNLCALLVYSYVIIDCPLGQYENMQNSKEIKLKFKFFAASTDQEHVYKINNTSTDGLHVILWSHEVSWKPTTSICVSTLVTRSDQSHLKYLFVLEIGGEFIALGERARPLDGLLLGLLAEDGLRVLELGPTGSLWPGLDPLAVQRAIESVGADG